MAIQMQGSLPSKFKLFELYIYILIAFNFLLK